MQQLTAVWSTLDPRRRVIVILATLAMFAGVLFLTRAASQPGMALLYAGLEGAAAGEVVTALEQAGIDYSVRGTAVYVPEAKRDELRMMLAAQGLPAAGGSGYELLDGLSGFGTTSQMFDAAYWRAKEGELARTILVTPGVKSARVHISAGSSQGFRQKELPTASVSVVTNGMVISTAHAKALKYLVSSAVPGLVPDNVSVIDGAGALVSAGDEAGGAGAAEDRAEQLRRNVERLLEARVGHGHAVVEVSVDTVTERESITERRFDPEGRVAISNETEERTTNSSASKSGNVTVASNLPAGDAAGAGGSSSTNSETKERTNFEVSETQREVLRTPGSIRRITVAVLVDGVRSVDDSGLESWAPLADDELSGLRELVASAVGFDEARGDVIILKSMPLDPIAEAGTTAEATGLAALGLDLMSLAQLGVLALVTLVLGLFVVRPILSGRNLARLPPPLSGLPAPNVVALDGVVDGAGSGNGALLPAIGGMALGDGMAEFSHEAVDPVTRLRRLIEERQEETVEILRNWMEDREETI